MFSAIWSLYYFLSLFLFTNYFCLKSLIPLYGHTIISNILFSFLLRVLCIEITNIFKPKTKKQNKKAPHSLSVCQNDFRPHNKSLFSLYHWVRGKNYEKKTLSLKRIEESLLKTVQKPQNNPPRPRVYVCRSIVRASTSSLLFFCSISLNSS